MIDRQGIVGLGVIVAGLLIAVLGQQIRTFQNSVKLRVFGWEPLIQSRYTLILYSLIGALVSLAGIFKLFPSLRNH